jgi:Domain of unknown function (DUF4145)
MAEPMRGSWGAFQANPIKRYVCGFCETFVGANFGSILHAEANASLRIAAELFICPHCKRPSFFEGPLQTPGVPFGGKVDHISEAVDGLYQEARRCASAGAHTAAVLACRKILMHTAVDKGAEAGRTFVEYVEFLSQKGYITPDAKGWVDEIRRRGNEANHEIRVMNLDDARDLLTLVEMLLKIIYEFPGRAPKPAHSAGAQGKASVVQKP